MRREGAKHQGARSKARLAASPAGPPSIAPHGIHGAASPSADAFAASLATPEGRSAAVSEMDAAIARLLSDHGEDQGRFLLERRGEPLAAAARYRISGDAMRGASIVEGDRVEIDAVAALKPGDLVLVSKEAGRYEARKAWLGAEGLSLRGEPPIDEAIDAAAPGEWTIHGVIRQVARDF
jgi:hypothetical protein